MNDSPDRHWELMLLLSQLMSDYCSDLEIYRRFHCGDKGTDVLKEHFVISVETARIIDEIAVFINDHPDLVVKNVRDTYCKVPPQTE